MTQGRLQQVISQYRAQLKAHEAQAEQALEHAYSQQLQLIQGRLDLLYQAIDLQMRSGASVPVEWLYEQHRMEAITSWIEGQINHFGALTQMQVGQLQYQGVQLGQQAAQALLQSTVPPGIAWSFGIPSQQAIANLVGATQKGSPLADLFAGFGAEAAQGVSDALITGVTLGYNPRDIAQLVQQALDVPRWRAETIARTEMLRSYRDAQSENYRANSDVVSQWRWTCDLSARTCAACLAMDGELFDLDQDMESHPNCRCTQVPVTASWADILGPLGIDTSDIPDTSAIDDMQSGSDWFDSQDESIQRQILGNAKYEAWQNGDFSLDDIVGYASDPVWGGSIYEKPLKELVK